MQNLIAFGAKNEIFMLGLSVCGCAVVCGAFKRVGLKWKVTQTFVLGLFIVFLSVLSSFLQLSRAEVSKPISVLLTQDLDEIPDLGILNLCEMSRLHLENEAYHGGVLAQLAEKDLENIMLTRTPYDKRNMTVIWVHNLRIRRVIQLGNELQLESDEAASAPKWQFLFVNNNGMDAIRRIAVK